MVEGDRPSRRAIARTPSSAASPREISSRSTKRKLRAARRRSRGRKPPARSTYHVTVALSHPNTALIWTAGSPCCQRDHNTSTSCDVSRLYLRAMDPSGECVISHLLHSPVEITVPSVKSVFKPLSLSCPRPSVLLSALVPRSARDEGSAFTKSKADPSLRSG